MTLDIINMRVIFVPKFNRKLCKRLTDSGTQNDTHMPYL